MVRANKLGIASLILLVLAVLPPYENWKQPINSALILIAFALAYFAGRSGKPAWYAVCVLLLALLAVAIYFALKSL